MRSSPHPDVFDLKFSIIRVREKTKQKRTRQGYVRGILMRDRKWLIAMGLHVSIGLITIFTRQLRKPFATVAKNKHVLSSNCFSLVVVTVAQDTHPERQIFIPLLTQGFFCLKVAGRQKVYSVLSYQA